MSKLPTNQTLILKNATGFGDGAILPLPEDVKLAGGALSRTLGALRKKGLAVKDDAGHWRITDAGRAEVGAPTPKQQPIEAPTPGRAGSKQAQLVELLQRPDGAALADIQAATGWQAHSVRGAISGVCKKKLGLNVISAVEEGRGRVYRIAGSA